MGKWRPRWSTSPGRAGPGPAGPTILDNPGGTYQLVVARTGRLVVGDPNAGVHAVNALLMAVEFRRRTGQGALIEAAMIDAALNIAAEQVIEYSADSTVPVRFSAGPERFHLQPAPLLGQHNHELLAEIGLSEAKIAELAAEGVIGRAPGGTKRAATR